MKAFLQKHRSSIILLGLMLFVRTTFANHYVVPTGSMLPTIVEGDRIFVNRIAYDLKLPFTNIVLKTLNDPERGQIVVFESPVDPSITLVKRLIAVPGDEVEIRNGFVFLNGKATTEEASPSDFPSNFPTHYNEQIGDHLHLVQRIPGYFRPEHFSFTVPAGKYFMMGDNRDNSGDGRVFGFVERKLLIGEAKRVLFSVNTEQPATQMIAFGRFGKALR